MIEYYVDRHWPFGPVYLETQNGYIEFSFEEDAIYFHRKGGGVLSGKGNGKVQYRIRMGDLQPLEPDEETELQIIERYRALVAMTTSEVYLSTPGGL